MICLLVRIKLGNTLIFWACENVFNNAAIFVISTTTMAPWQMLTGRRGVSTFLLMLELVEKELNNHHSSNDLAGECIKCFVGNVTEAKPENLVDCDNLGIQREELYCRNITIYQNGEDSPIESVQRSCVAMSWYVNVNPNHYYWTFLTPSTMLYCSPIPTITHLY